jgi:hypothetical protein
LRSIALLSSSTPGAGLGEERLGDTRRTDVVSIPPT